MKTTPRPWYVDGPKKEYVIGKDGHTIADCCGSENAELIVKAVNAYKGGSNGNSR